MDALGRRMVLPYAVPHRGKICQDVFDHAGYAFRALYSGDFSAFRPKLVWNRGDGILTARPGAQLDVLSSGTNFRDRGMYSVLLPEGEEKAGSRRVGELDEEMSI